MIYNLTILRFKRVARACARAIAPRRASAILLALFTMLLTSAANAAVWTTTRQWDHEAEREYELWVQYYWKDDVFINAKSAYANIETDCADATYAMRIIFAYERGLPFATTANPSQSKSRTKTEQFGIETESQQSVRLITNETRRFDHISDQQERFRAFLQWIFDFVSTKSLAQDTYPIAISRQSIRPGVIYVAPGKHSYQVIDLLDTGVPLIMSSTEPKAARYLSVLRTFPQFVPGEESHDAYVDGFRRFKTPEQMQIEEENLPEYSLDQFQLSQRVNYDWTKFSDLAMKKMALRNETLTERSARLMNNICLTSYLRAYTIFLSEWKKSYRQQADREFCFRGSDYDQYSTPSRDARMLGLFQEVQKLMNNEAWSAENTEIRFMIEAIFSKDDSEETNKWSERLLNWCRVDRADGGPKTPYSLKDLYWALKTNGATSDPNGNLRQRWGLEPYTPVCK